MDNRYRTVFQAQRPAGLAGQPNMPPAAMQHHQRMAQMQNASVANRARQQQQSLVAFNPHDEPMVGAKTDVKTAAAFIVGFVAGWAFLPDDGSIPKPNLVVQF